MLRDFSKYRYTLRCDQFHEHVSLRSSVEFVDLESDVVIAQVWISSNEFSGSPMRQSTDLRVLSHNREEKRFQARFDV